MQNMPPCQSIGRESIKQGFLREKSRYAGVAELADAQDSGSCGRKVVKVQVLSPALLLLLFLLAGKLILEADSPASNLLIAALLRPTKALFSVRRWFSSSQACPRTDCPDYLGSTCRKSVIVVS